MYAIVIWIYIKCRQGTKGSSVSAHKEKTHVYMCVKSKELICGSAMFCRDWAMLLLVLGDALGKHALDNSTDSQVLLPCDGSNLGNQF